MPVKPLRRIGAPVGESLFEQMSSRMLHGLYWRKDVDALEREHPDLILRDGANIVAALPAGEARLLYGFENDRAFIERFPAMFETLLPRIRRELRAETVRLRLSYAPARPRIEPVLRNLSFEPKRDWLEFWLPRGTKLLAAPVPRGVRIREGGIADVPELVRIDRAAFPDTPLPAESFRERLLKREEQIIVATVGGSPAAFCLFAATDPGDGYIGVLAVDEEQRGRGLGAALTVRACKTLFAGGAQRVGLTTDESNGAAIKLYVRLGFRQEGAGRDYTRPTDPKTIERRKKAAEGTLIRFGGWR